MGIVDSPVRPKLLAESSKQLTSTVRRPRSFDDDDIEEMATAWQISAMQELRKARELADRYPASATALARLADTALIAGDDDQALEAAVKVLENGAQSCREGRAGDLDKPATYVTIQVLLRLGKEQLADRYLREMAAVPELAQVGAAVLIRMSRFDDALAALTDLDESLPGVASIRGYIHLLRDEYSKAISHLRAAYRSDPNDVDSILNLAASLWHLDARRKAIRWAKQATIIAPGRYDTFLALLRYLIESRRFDAADSEIKALLERGVVPTSALILLQAQVAAGKDQPSRAGNLLRRARALAGEEKDDVSAAELDGRIAVSEYVSGRIDRPDALQRVRAALRRTPSSALLAALLADLIDKSSGAREVEVALSKVDRVGQGSVIKGIECRLAFLKGDFDQAAQLCLAWVRQEPLNERAIKLATFWHGALYEEWNDAADRTIRAIERLGTSKSLINPAAYSLALARRGDEALALLERVDTSDFVLTATKGLAHISVGQVEEGLALYRRAAQLADEQESGKHHRLLMTLHQAMGLRRLGLTETHAEVVRAAALPAVDLPSNWREIADLAFLAEVARRRGWSWPVMIE
ncbi:tetratricopeptide repeat protein [Micromonospora sp. DT227]|uniref:tetratricopeptide repeat protein n=1 Tax=Micromonospora sp. DT227 TaxID=3393433 RepID=UPI003CE93160